MSKVLIDVISNLTFLFTKMLVEQSLIRLIFLQCTDTRLITVQKMNKNIRVAVLPLIGRFFLLA